MKPKVTSIRPLLNKYLLLLLLAGLPGLGFSQDPLKMGQTTAEELNMKVYAPDTSAAAVVLYDYGHSSFLYTKGTQVQLRRLLRIKILKKAGLDQANISIPFYRKDFNNKEEVLDLKGFTYNLEGGKVVKVKLDEKAVFEEKEDINWYVKKLAMPNVKVGSVIEVAYTLKSDYISNLRDWTFQNTIPVAWSEYRVNMMPFYEYTHLLHGFQKFHIEDMKVISQAIAYTSQQQSDKITSEKWGSATYKIAQYRWVMKDVPAFTDEPYMTSVGDYLSQLEFTLTKIQYPDEQPTYMAGTWEGLATELQKEEEFGMQLQNTAIFKKAVEEASANSPDLLSKVKSIEAYVKKQMTWDGKHRIFSESIKKAHEARTGSSADINLLLTAMLREAGIDAKPMLVSTRSHGYPAVNMPMLSKFNYVIAAVKVGETTYLLDATERNLPFGVLPYRCLNGQGWVTSLPAGKWMALKNNERNVQLVSAHMEIKPTGEVIGKMEESYGGLAAHQMRAHIREQGQESYLKKLTSQDPEWTRQEISLVNLEKNDTDLKASYKLHRVGETQPVSLLYVSPMLNHATQQNPFKSATRLFPIDFATPVDETYVFTYTLPAGYEVEEMPKAINVSLPDNSAKFSYIVQVTEGKLQIMSKLNINKPVFNAKEYNDLRELYNRMVAKHAEKVVLKKKS
ncbi:hypothetical protein TH61_07055 [Rufibacter sp. DG15C]|uniref:DUF3857 domain-containing protein n=1 Tax=Rufibacter sp. DG15C TaxID=1379909 RepID=UPI00078E7CD1|nr:DUF3857 domain-containing protein [Rufibacter sp. DG15C]AMM50990.1 hypothetical protein TH61_07055 [Rufibacter sp. DG15C]